MTASLAYHKYSYYPYERDLALREVTQLLNPQKIDQHEDRIEISDIELPENAKRLVYFANVQNGRFAFDTLQSRLERAATSGKNRQATRYSVHGLHEYKGKFNPQIVKAILNIFDIQPGNSILDPFCGSGTTLIECAHIGVDGYGFDLNPFAIYLANVKLQALRTPVSDLYDCLSKISVALLKTKQKCVRSLSSERDKYLNNWFTPEILETIEIARKNIELHGGKYAPIFLSIASNLLREYSLQDPKDLRIRRRKSPLPIQPFCEAFLSSCEAFLSKLTDTQSVLGVKQSSGKALLHNTTQQTNKKIHKKYDAAITSPPYAMALPYIDTQRLSLVWLKLISASNILQLESDLVGSREIRGTSRRELQAQIGANKAVLPEPQHLFCAELAANLGTQDGFRRQAVPMLLYRYFAAMRDSFKCVHTQLNKGAPYALVVGHNHTVLGGTRYDIDTPRHLANLAESVGWKITEMLPLQTYQRYGYHMDNAVTAETLILLRKP